MGADASLIYEIARAAKRWNFHGPLGTLGVVHHQSNAVEIDAALRAAGMESNAVQDPFLQIGFGCVESLDISRFEGCTHVFDLNSTSLPEHLKERFGAIYNGGTLEHIFDVRSALGNIFGMLRVGGVVIDGAPVNGWVDHGFYQFSPTFFTDFYRANGFEILEARLLEYKARERSVIVRPYVPGSLDGRPQNSFSEALLYFGVARKTAASTCHISPQQRRYAEIHNGPTLPVNSALEYFLPYRIVEGRAEECRLIKIAISSWRKGEGYELITHIPELLALSDNASHRQSPLILLENNEVLGPPQTSHDKIKSVGLGAYSHWGEWLHFSTSDNLEPGQRLYRCAIPLDAYKRMKTVGVWQRVFASFRMRS
jgi:hypothetical protein